uniref:Uncharacterized protein n=1 Tax=Schistosoma haematobium TaxID=6185 RepID=A0A094ZYT4_SCHHA
MDIKYSPLFSVKDELLDEIFMFNLFVESKLATIHRRFDIENIKETNRLTNITPNDANLLQTYSDIYLNMKISSKSSSLTENNGKSLDERKSTLGETENQYKESKLRVISTNKELIETNLAFSNFCGEFHGQSNPTT